MSRFDADDVYCILGVYVFKTGSFVALILPAAF